MAYADDIVLIINNQDELDIVNEHLKNYEKASGAKLNQHKTEAVWFGNPNNKVPLAIKDQAKTTILGLEFSHTCSYNDNWSAKEREVIEELSKWENKNTTYKLRILIIKTFVLSKLMFLTNIFPPQAHTIKRLNKLLVNFIWGTTREVAKRELLFKSRKGGGLGAMDVPLKLLITFCKTIAAGVQRNAVWVGHRSRWEKKKGRARNNIPYYVLAYSDFRAKHGHLPINWVADSNKKIYKIISNDLYGGYVLYKGLQAEHYGTCVRNIFTRDMAESKRDIMWLVSVGRLAVRAVVKWSCFVKTKCCPVDGCQQDETIDHLLLECPRARDVWARIKDIGLDVEVNRNTVMFGIFVVEDQMYAGLA
ncbi:uncharacterized protein LOC128753866 [Synchiropus splendidus]|uniref:uncharacterized protein LOC128753866 n=1 Tax=Synchiropus splendidus TaxID=270530 RepID=UPI00237DC8F2|nr:uncharacterized protein LOC128753866 [Synchiropus splendidus]